ncbi:MAG: GntR family transcriptional regulator [Anaerolineales bacterium]|nr:GntR family transcriptional regulator [Anaerolineales bacterium]MDW8162194.1 GntR family transcriptional regulator [Anaerolineales bacterium]
MSFPNPSWNKIDRSSPLPYYIQLKEAIREQIEGGYWRQGDLLPSEPELCSLFNVSRTVVRQALLELEYEGLIVRQRGKGTFVAAPKISESLVQRLTGFYQDMVALGHTPVTKVLKQELVPANHKIATNLQVETGAWVIQIDRLRFINNEPIVLVTTYLPYSLCPSVLKAQLANQSLYSFLEKECGLYLARGRRVIEAVPANEYEALLLQIDKGAPLIKLESVSFLEDGTPIEYYIALHRGDRSRFEVELVRNKEQLEKIELPTGNLLIE